VWTTGRTSSSRWTTSSAGGTDTFLTSSSPNYQESVYQLVQHALTGEGADGPLVLQQETNARSWVHPAGGEGTGWFTGRLIAAAGCWLLAGL